MKGAILSVNPEARIVDVTHDVAPADVRQGAFLLAAAAPFFPAGAVHVAVVDPGVGGPRRPLAIRCERGWLVGPDNGLLAPAAKALGPVEARHLTEARFFRESVAPTFHGRDVFATVAAHLDLGGAECFAMLGPAVADTVGLDLLEGARAVGGRLEGVVLHVDRFGNCILNVPQAMAEDVGEGAALHLAGPVKKRVRRVRTYSDAERGETVLLVSSSGFLELAVREGHASQALRLKAGDRVVLEG